MATKNASAGKKRTTKRAGTKTKKVAKAEVSKGLGALVWWSIGGARISPDRLRDILAAEGLAINVPSINKCSVVKSEAYSFKVGRGKADRFKTDVVFEDDDTIEIGLLKRVKPGAHETAWSQVDMCVWDKNSGTWLADGSSKELERFREKCNEFHVVYDHRFIRPAILQEELYVANAILLKPHGGGPYYVPQAQLDRIYRLERICAQIGNMALDIFDVRDSEHSRKNVERGVVASLKGTFNELQEKITEWRERAKETGRSPRQDAATSCLGDFKILKEQIDMFKDALNIRVDDIEDSLEVASTELRAMLEMPSENGGPVPSRMVMSRITSLVETKKPNAKGVIAVNFDDIKAVGFKKSAWSYAAYWSAGNSGGRAARALKLFSRLNPEDGCVEFKSMENV